MKNVPLINTQLDLGVPIQKVGPNRFSGLFVHAFASLLLFVSPTLKAQIPVERHLRVLVEDYLAKKEVPPFPAKLTREQAEWFQNAFVEALIPKLGKPAGYKVGLITKEAQDRFGTDQPVRGRLLSGMLLPNGSEVPVDYGVRPVCEADLIVTVKDSGINRAQSPLQALDHLKEIVAFIELADSFMATNPPLDALALTASNVGARSGIMGQRLPLKANAETYNALAEMLVSVRDQNGTDLGQARGNTILSHPLNAVLWLVEDLNKAGKKLKSGDVLSLGSMKVFPAKAGQTVAVEYRGLPGGTISATVRFK